MRKTRMECLTTTQGHLKAAKPRGCQGPSSHLFSNPPMASLSFEEMILKSRDPTCAFKIKKIYVDARTCEHAATPFMFLWSYYTFEQYLAVCITQIISHNSGCLWLWGESGWCAVVDCMQQSFEGLQTAATAKFGWRMKHTGSSSTPRNDRLLHIDYLWIAGCSIQDRPTLCVHAIVLGMQMGQSY